jgi:hypothetical protein
MLFQLKHSLASINLKIKITKLLVIGLIQLVLLTMNYYNILLRSSYNISVNLRFVIQKLK